MLVFISNTRVSDQISHCAASKEEKKKKSLLWFNAYNDLIDIMIPMLHQRNAAA